MRQDLYNTKDLQRDFLNSIIHEIRNPLNIIVGLSSILRNDHIHKISEEERKEYLKDIDESAHDLNELVYDLMDVGTMNSGISGFSINLNSKINVKNLIIRSCRLNKDYAISRGIKISTNISNFLPDIHLDLKRMKQILANIISNAIKYSPSGSTIKISADKFTNNAQSYLKIIVSDQGFGMTPQQIKIAFQREKILKNPNTGKVDSFGLGLPIVKELVELQNGSITVNSKPNHGSEFIIQFPY